MGEVKNSLEKHISDIASSFLEKTKGREIQVISHFDTDGISSAVIITKALKRLDKKFSLKIVKSLEKELILSLPNKITLFLDLASGSLDHISYSQLEDVFVIDHHEIIQSIPSKVSLINPHLHKKEKISSSSLSYLFARELDSQNKDLAKLAILGMVGDMMEKNIDKLNNGILEDGEIKRKRGLLIYPSTRPLNRTLEFSSNPFIPGITGNAEGVTEILRESGIEPQNGKYKNIIDLSKEEMERLVTAIMLRSPQAKPQEIIGDIFLIKLFNKLEDAREISAMVNACSRLGHSDIAMSFLMELPDAKKRAEAIHIKYKQNIISGLKHISSIEKIEGRGFVIINAGHNIKDTIIGTLASILQNSSMYEEGTIITTMAHYGEKIKVSARSVGKTGRNVREILARVVDQIGGEVGGHEHAAGCNISREKEAEFLNLLKKNLEIEVVRV